MSSSSVMIVAVITMALAGLVVPPPPAQAETQTQFRTTRVYIQCTGDTQFENVNALYYEEYSAPWFTGKPTESLAEGGGCGVDDPIQMQDEDPRYRGGEYDLNWSGTYRGNLDAIVVEAHVAGQLPPGAEIGAQLFINGYDVTGEVVTPVRANASEDGAMSVVEFAFDDLGLIEFSEGYGAVRRHVIVRLFAADPRTPNITWLWGATEALAGLTFNGDTAELPTVGTDTSKVGDERPADLPNDDS